MTEADAQAWLQMHEIRSAVKPSMYVDRPGWRFTLMRTSKEPIRLTVPEKSAVSFLKFLAREAWAEYPIRKSSPLATKLWSFFSLEELRELYSESLDAEI